ncbi:MAG TPA: molybdopterin cofactor-binding domain-containing protein [Chloroflexota bacterium]|jgi:isoquinoline 1-oxidoreductase|nr:molybdopterin cofactor-binding domain-containing protein [Chloroflexota bacterium]
MIAPAAPPSGTAPAAVPGGQHLSDWLRVGRDGTVTVFCGKVEVGQGARTSLCQIVADELAAPLEQVRIVLGDTGRTPFDQGTFASRTTATMGVQLRLVAADLRERLLEYAANAWGVEPAELQAAGGCVRHAASGRCMRYGDIAADGRFTGVLVERPVKAPEHWSVAGSSAPKAQARDIVTGRHRYTPDLSLPGMLHGRVLRPPRFGATLLRLDAEAAREIPHAVIVQADGFVGVAAPSLQRADQALAALRAEWTQPEAVSDQGLAAYLRTHPDEPAPAGRPASQVQETGDVDGAFATAPVRSDATYTVAFIAHAPLETRAALADWQDGHLTVWTGTQRPFGVRGQLATALGIPEHDVQVIVPDTGSAYGGKHTGEAAIEASRLARAAGRPVKLVWTREEEFSQAYFRPAAVIDVRGAADDAGHLLAWECHNYNAGPGALRSPYAVPNQRAAYHPVRSPLRQGSYRALAATANIFARESAMDDLAHRLGLDPLEFRLRNLTDPRLRAVLLAAAERFGWDDRPAEAQIGCGLACGAEKGGYVACCAELAVEPVSGRVIIHRLVQAYECGAVVNPANVHNQIEGAMVQGLGGALFEQIEFAGGRILNPRFSRYRVPRFGDVPRIDTVLLNRPDLPSAGAGETPITVVAPAISNAIFAACGERLRALPMLPAGMLRQHARIGENAAALR